MQATVHTFDADTRSGQVLADTGELHPFGEAAFLTAGLRHVRLGQRLTVELDADGTVTTLRLGSITPRTGI